MKNPQLNRRLSSIDSVFLYLEKKECPMHIGSTSIFEGRLTHRGLVRHIKARLHLIPRYTQKVVPDPFNLAHPMWEFDENFDIKNHIFKVSRKKYFSEDDLETLAGEIWTSVMDREKPLWELYVVENVEDNRSALIAKIHHCMVDGISGVDLMKILFDITPETEPPPPPPPKKEIKETSKKEPVQMLFESLLDSVQEMMARSQEMIGGSMYLAANLADTQNIENLPHLSEVLPAVASPPPILPFNGICSGVRRVAWTAFSFADARMIRNILGGTVNDVVLTVLSEAAARYTRFHDQPIKEKQVRFMVPVSLRQKEQRGSLGNLISILPVEIPLETKNFAERFKTVNEKTALMKSTRLAEGLMMFGAMYAMMPAGLQSIAATVADLPFPPFNLVATNVPGPQVPLYLAGRKMLAQYPYVPVGYGLGLGCAVLSYNQMFYFGLSSDEQAMPDVEKFKEILEEVFSDLKSEVENELLKGKDANSRK